MNDTAQALRSGAEHNYQFVAEPVVTGPTKNVSAFGVKRAGGNCSFEITPTLDSGGGGGFGNGMSVFGPTMRVRRLTTRECERLQGFPDDYTLIPHKGKPASDSARYKAIGNSWAVPCARWIGERIQMVEDVLNK
jgi:DNA (cytosine-5)-methyltransferase 1